MRVLANGWACPVGASVDYLRAFSVSTPLARPPTMSLFLDIGQGAGLAGSAGIRPFLPPLLVGALARGDRGIDFDGTDWSFLEAPGFLFAVLALAVGWYLAERAGAGRRSLRVAGLALSVVMGALLFAGALAAEGRPSTAGIAGGVACAALAFFAVNGLLDRAARRLDGDARGFLVLYADGVALVLAAIAVFVPPLSLLALVAFVAVLAKDRAAGDRKYAGLRILR